MRLKRSSGALLRAAADQGSAESLNIPHPGVESSIARLQWRRRQGMFGRGTATTFWMALSFLSVGILQGAFKVPIERAILAGVPFVYMAGRALKRRAAKDQRRRDVDAACLLDQIDRGESTRFSLYLRTFAVTGALPTGRVFKSFPLSVGPLLDFETALEKAVCEDAPLVALGRPGEHVGAGRISTDDSAWQEDLLRLANASAAIFVIPSSRAGTAWEIETIVASELWKKSIFLMPPRLTRELAKTWDADRKHLAKIGITIPKYVTDGMLFTLDRRGQVNGRVDLRDKALACAIQEVRADARSTPDVDVRDLLDGQKLLVSKRCPQCGSEKVRPPSPAEGKAMKALVNVGGDFALSDFQNQVTCADCGTKYTRRLGWLAELAFACLALICCLVIFVFFVVVILALFF